MNHWKTWHFGDKDYLVNVWVFRFIALTCLGILGFLFYQDSFSGEVHGYSVCPNTTQGQCFNVFYRSNQCKDGTLKPDNPLCTTELMFPGQELGEKPSWLFSNVWIIVVGLCLLGIVLNTLLWNRHFFKGGSSKPPSDKPIGGVV